MQVVQRIAGANMSVDVSVGDVHLELPSTNYSFWGWQDAATNVPITTAPVTNSRIDAIVAWVDTSVVNVSLNNSPGSLKFSAIVGTVAGSPVAPLDAAIQTALGSSVAWTRLANVTVGTGVSSIVNANIADVRVAINMRAGLPANSVNGAVALQDNSVSASKIQPSSFATYPAFKVYRSAALNSSNTGAVVAFDTKVFDLGTNIDVVTNKGRFTAPYTGVYNFSGGAGNTVATSTSMYVQLKVNGTNVSTGSLSISGSPPNYSHISTTVKLNASDYVELFFVGGSGSVMGVGLELCWFSGHLVFRTA